MKSFCRLAKPGQNFKTRESISKGSWEETPYISVYSSYSESWLSYSPYIRIDKIFFLIWSLLQNIFMYWQSKITSGHQISFQKIFKSNTICKTFMKPTTKEEVVQNLCNKRLDDCDQRKSFEIFIHTSELSSTSSLSLLGLELQSWGIRDRNRESIPVNVTENLKNTTS